MNHLGDIIRERLERFWELVDSDSILINQMIFYVLIAVSGLYNLTAGSSVPIQAMQESASPGYYTFWLWLCLCGPLATILGKLCRGTWAYGGLWLQLAGDMSTWIVCLTYVSATFGSAYWGKGLFAGFIVMACAIGTPVFIARGIRKLSQVEARVRKIEEVGH